MNANGRVKKAERLGDFVRVRTGKLDANASSGDGEYPFFTCSEQPLRIASFSYDCECVLVAGNGDLNVKYYKGKFDAYQRTYIIESADAQALDVRFLFHFMSVYVEQLRAMSVGGVIKYIKLGYLTDARISLPPLAEQRRIAEVLDRAEALRAKRRAALAQLDSLTQSLFLDLFGDPATGAKKFPTARLGAVTTFIDYRGISPNKQPSGVRLVTARNIKRGWFESEPQEFIPAAEYESWMTRGMPRAGDVLFTTEGHTLGSAALLPRFEKAALAQRLIALQPNDQLCSEYLLQIILDRIFQREVFRRATGSAARGISSKQLAEILVAVPPISLQREFARRVTAVEALKTAQRASLAELDALFATLQHRAFRGELFGVPPSGGKAHERKGA